MCRHFLVFAAFILTSHGGDAPIFRSVPTTVKTSEHDTVLLPCFVENLGENSVRWWKDETLVWDTNKPSLHLPANMRVFPNQTLEVADLRALDTGEYTCQVVRPEPWGPINQVHAIEVLFPPLVRTIPENGELEVELGQEVVMSCIATGVPQPIISWSYKGEEMQLINNRATLRFKATDRKMGGNYQCTASNGVGDTAAATIHLKIIFPPEVGADRLWVHASPGERAELSCTIFSDPDAKVEWFQDGRPVETGGRIITHRIADKHILIIRNVRISDLGYFTCRATNFLGRSQQSIHLSGVANIAVFKRGPIQSSIQNYTLIWEVESYSPIIEYSLLFRKHQLYSKPDEWSKLIIPADSYSLGPIHSQSYTITGLSTSTVYEASVLSRNRFGWSRPSHIFRFATKGAGLFTELSKEIVEQEEKEAAAEEEEKKLKEIEENPLDEVKNDLSSPEYQGLENSANIKHCSTIVLATFFISYLPIL